MHACAKLRTKNPFVQISWDNSTERTKKKEETKDRQELSANVKQFYLTNMH